MRNIDRIAVGVAFNLIACKRWASGCGREPFIPDGTTVAFNTNDKRIIDGKIYSISQNGWNRIKLLYQVGPNTVSIRSYNSAEHPVEEKSLSEVDIIGRVF
ncbi:MAG: S24 family peptidase [Symbiopectobacterium sp.]|uniref:S24 family peptidase n=1 Tax=Symbiopectobacterium sp. TaxID=2952789 RepID=UPI003F332D7C